MITVQASVTGPRSLRNASLLCLGNQCLITSRDRRVIAKPTKKPQRISGASESHCHQRSSCGPKRKDHLGK